MTTPCVSEAPRHGCVEPALTSLLVEAIKEITTAEAASILVPDQDGNLVFALVAGGAGLHLSQVKVPIEGNVCGRVFRTGLPEIAHFPAQSAASSHIQEQTGFITKSLLAVPLLDETGSIFAVAEAVNPILGSGPKDSFRESHLRALLDVRQPLGEAFRALQQLNEDPSAMPRFYRAVVSVMDCRTDILRQRNADLHSSRRVFEMTRARHYSDEKMMALARMASGIAHEINNPLSVALSNLGSLSETCADLTVSTRTEDEQELIDDIAAMTQDVRSELDRIAKIVSRLMFFGDRDLRTIERVDVADEATRIAGVLDENRARDLDLMIEAEVVPHILAGRSHVRQVLLELIENAVHAASRSKDPEGGKVHVRIFSSGGTVHASVGDNGPGIEARNVERVFEPFFTDKSDWAATGLGLTAAYGVMQLLGGQIAIDSVPGRGTIVVASFPIDQPTTGATEAPHESELAANRDSRAPADLGSSDSGSAHPSTERADTWRGRIKPTSGRYYDDLQ